MSDEGSDEGSASAEGNDSFPDRFASGARSGAGKGPCQALDGAPRGVSEAERVVLTHLRRRMAALADRHRAARLPLGASSAACEPGDQRGRTSFPHAQTRSGRARRNPNLRDGENTWSC